MAAGWASLVLYSRFPCLLCLGPPGGWQQHPGRHAKYGLGTVVKISPQAYRYITTNFSITIKRTPHCKIQEGGGGVS